MSQVLNSSNSNCQVTEIDGDGEDQNIITVYQPKSQDKLYDAASDVLDGSLLFVRGICKISHTICTDVIIPTGKVLHKYIKNIITDHSETGYQESEEGDNIVIFEEQ